MVDVNVRCPVCEKDGKIEVLEDVMKNVTKGLLVVTIAKGIVCEHSFNAYIDKNYDVRDSFMIDFQIELPDLGTMENNKVISHPLKEGFDVDLIRLNIPSALLTYILKSIFSKQKIVLISNQEFLNDHITNFFNYITQDSFEVNIKMMSNEDYKKRKKEFKDFIIFKGNEIVRDKKKLINPKKLLTEKSIVGRFLSEYESGSSDIILKNEIQKAYELSKAVVNHVNDEKEKGQKPNILKIQSTLEKQYNIKINTLYLKFLIDVAVRYFEISVPSLIDGFYDLL